jgi:hypothetical protein
MALADKGIFARQLSNKKLSNSDCVKYVLVDGFEINFSNMKFKIGLKQLS